MPIATGAGLEMRLAEIEKRIAALERGNPRAIWCTCQVMTGGHVAHSPNCPIHGTSPGQ